MHRFVFCINKYFVSLEEEEEDGKDKPGVGCGHFKSGNKIRPLEMKPFDSD